MVLLYPVFNFGLFHSQPPSRNRRERAELRPDFFDSAAMIEDESVSKTLLLIAIKLLIKKLI